MLLKISLGLAILLGLATVFISHTQVGGKIATLNEDLTNTRSQLATTQQSEQKLRVEARNLRGQLESTNALLAETTRALTDASAKAQEQQARADRAAAELNTVTAERNTAQQELSQWRLFELSPEQIRNNLTRLRQVERELDTAAADNQALNRRREDLERRLARYEGDIEPDIELPSTAKGQIVAVDPKYDFVILNIGGNQGLVPDAKLLVSRDGKLIGTVKITSVEPNRAIGNVLPEWKQDELMEGDEVIPYKVRL
jgi:regulator of replication initiation timing